MQLNNTDYVRVVSRASCLSNADSPRVHPSRSRPNMAFEPCTATWSASLREANSSPYTQLELPIQVWRRFELLTSVLDYEADSSPLLAGEECSWSPLWAWVTRLTLAPNWHHPKERCQPDSDWQTSAFFQAFNPWLILTSQAARSGVNASGPAKPPLWAASTAHRAVDP